MLSKNHDLRLSYATGFRSPSLRELYFSFFDANHQVVGNPDLKAETSHSFTGTLACNRKLENGVNWTAQLGGFYNDVKNLIDFVFTQGSDTAKLYNVLNSTTAGINLSASVTFGNWNISAGAAGTGFYNDLYSTGDNLPRQLWSVEANSNISYRFNKAGLDLGIFYKLVGQRPRYVTDGPNVVLSEQDAYHLADFTALKKMGKLFRINAGVRNLFDVSRVRSSFTQGGIHTGGGLSVGTGRSYFIGLV